MGMERQPEETTKRSCLLRKVATGKHSLLYLMEDVSEYILIFLLLIILILHLVLGNANMLLIRRISEIYLRKEGMDEPNKDYVWAANTIITLDFRAAKGTIVVP